MRSYSILYDQLPDYFKQVAEFQQILKAHGYALDQFDTDMATVYYNQFIQSADENTIRFWEELFHLTIRYGDTLEYRRSRLIQKFSMIVPYTIWDLKDRLTSLFGNDWTMDVDLNAYKITVFTTSDRYGAIDLLYDLLWDVIPAHYVIKANQQVTDNVESDQYIGIFMTNTFTQTISPGGN